MKILFGPPLGSFFGFRSFGFADDFVVADFLADFFWGVAIPVECQTAFTRTRHKVRVFNAAGEVQQTIAFDERSAWQRVCRCLR